MKKLQLTALDRYAFFKSAYFQRRDYLVNDGMMPEDKYELELDEDFNKNNLAPVYLFITM
ncbi:MAG: hypothetical protein WC856_18250 [Methylococcaceae bacterium]